MRIFQICLVCFSLLLTTGCEREHGPAQPSPGAWQVAVVELGSRSSPSASVGGEIPALFVDFEGDRGFARATVVVEEVAPGLPPRGELYDTLFPVDRHARLTTSITAGGQATDARVVLRSESGQETSTTFVEPHVPFLANGSRVTLTTTAASGQRLADGVEVEIGRYLVVAAPRTTTVAIRLLLSTRPTGPRLKPEVRTPR